MSERTTLDENIEAFLEMSDELNEHHLYKFVLIHNRELIGSFDTLDDVVKEAMKKLDDNDHYLIRQVGMPSKVSMLASAVFFPVS